MAPSEMAMPGSSEETSDSDDNPWRGDTGGAWLHRCIEAWLPAAAAVEIMVGPARSSRANCATGTARHGKPLLVSCLGQAIST